MTSAKFDQAACEALAQQVREIESNTDAEIVIVVRARSGPYRHADYLFGASCWRLPACSSFCFPL